MSKKKERELLKEIKDLREHVRWIVDVDLPWYRNEIARRSAALSQIQERAADGLCEEDV